MRPEDLLEHRSVREQATVGSILNETENYLNIDGYLYSIVSLKELPDATFPGMLQRFSSVGFPLVISGQVTIPDQIKVLKGYKRRLKKMIAAQKDSDGNHKSNPEAEIAQAQLMQVQRDIVSSSLKTAKLSLSVIVRTSRQAVTYRQLEENEQKLANRTQEVLNSFQRMNGAKAVLETIAKRRIFIGALPGMGETDKREQDMLTPNAADLLPTEMPWTGTRRSPLILFETPFRQLIPYSMFDPDFANANGLIMGTSGSGKTQIARTLANESGLGFLAATTADIKANFLGQSGNRVKQLFERARANAPVILFLDELDIIAPARTGGNDALTDEIVGQLLQELDGIQSRDSEVFLLAATNHIDQIDPAVLSRFQERISIPLPDFEARERLLSVLLQKKRLAFDVAEGARTLAAMSEGKGMSGRDLESWVSRAERKALPRAIAAGGPQHFALMVEDFDSLETATTVSG
jgi:hypothetical protein